MDKDGSCAPGGAGGKLVRDWVADQPSIDVAAGVFRALGEPARLKILALLLARGELCVGDITELLNDNLSTISQRLKLLRSERVVVARRAGKHIYYSLADGHIAELVSNGLAHAREPQFGLNRGGQTAS